MKKVRKILAYVLAISMMFSCIGVNAYAAPADDLTIEDFSLTLTETAGTLSVALVCSKKVSAWAAGAGVMTVTDSEGNDAKQYFGLPSIEVMIGDGGGNSNTGEWSSTASNTEDGDTLESGTWAEYTYTLAENVPSGEYTFKMRFLADDNYEAVGKEEDYSVGGQIVTATYSVGTTGGEGVTTTGYTAALSTSASNNEVVSEGQICVNVTVNHSSDDFFNAGEIKLSYDSTKLTPDRTKLDVLMTQYALTGYQINENELILECFGDDKSVPYTYSIYFNAAEVNTEITDTITLARAAFIHKENADKSDLIEASKTTESLTVTIKPAMVNVTLTNSADSTSTTTTTQKGVAYTFAPNDTANYTYSNVSATVNSVEVEVTDNGDGTFTIAAEDVTGDIVLTYTKTANSYGVTINTVFGEDTTTKTEIATYNTAYEFTVPDDEPAGTNVGYTYALTSVTINGQTYTDYSCEQGTRNYTIPGADITGAIVITITKTEQPANIFSVSVDGTGTGNATVNNENNQVAKDGTASITVTPETGYTYTVTAKMGDETATVVPNGNTYSVEKVTGNVVFTVTKTLITEGLVNVYDYLTLDSETGEKLWLVTFNPTLAEGKIPTYNGVNMFWSEKYSAYCYLVKATSLVEADASQKLGTATATAANVDYSGNVNGTTLTDAADAQFVANMYNGMYKDFTTVTMDKFLAADMNGDYKLKIDDAQVIINQILGIDNSN